jgi:hypothetical protein
MYMLDGDSKFKELKNKIAIRHLGGRTGHEQKRTGYDGFQGLIQQDEFS